MKNWAGNITWEPGEIAFPSSASEVQQLILRAANDGIKVRTIGTGHSFTALSKTKDLLISLDQYQGLISVDREKCTATVKAGTKLNHLGELLFEQGLAMENMGDIDAQSIAGTISTGTHGTGLNFGTISTQVIGLEFINGKGEVVECSPSNNPHLFKAAQVSLGLLGVITAVTLQCVPAYKLRLQNKREPLDKVLSELNQRNSRNRNFEFYWFPYTTTAWTKTSKLVEDSEPDKVGFFNYWSEYVLENYAFKVLCEVARLAPGLNKTVAQISAAAVSNVSKVYHSHKVYATQRMVRFREMEYNIPAEAYQEVFREVQKTVNKKRFNIHFPIENRFVKRDDIYLSPAYGRDSAYIAAHVYNKKDHRPYFNALEEIYQAHGGRPHWGKMNTMNPQRAKASYPELDKFLQHRHEQDPEQIFVTPYFKEVFGI